MKNSRQFSICVQGGKTHRKIDKIILKNNPKIDHRLLEEYERLVRRSGGTISTRKQGADYNLAHPLARKDMPTDVYHRGKRVRETERA